MLKFFHLTRASLICRKGIILSHGIYMPSSIFHRIPLQNQMHLSFRCISTTLPEQPSQPKLSQSVDEDIDLSNFKIPDPPVFKPPSYYLEGYPEASEVNITWWLPTGWIYHALLSLEQYTPWTTAIPIVTLIARLLLTPVIISQQKFNIKLNNLSPYLKLYTKKAREAQQCGNYMEEARFYAKLANFYKEADLKQTRSLVNTLIQGAVFASFFLTLRSVSNAPLFSLTYEGLPWCSDFTKSDPTFLLNISTCLTLGIVLKLGIDFSLQTISGYARLWQNVFIFVPPIIILIFTHFLPATLAYYWTCNNIISILQALILRNKSIRQIIKLPAKNIPDLIVDKAGNESFFKNVKQSYKENKLLNKGDISYQSRHQRFLKAGMGPIIKTYDTDPTK